MAFLARSVVSNQGRWASRKTEVKASCPGNLLEVGTACWASPFWVTRCVAGENFHVVGMFDKDSVVAYKNCVVSMEEEVGKRQAGDCSHGLHIFGPTNTHTLYFISFRRDCLQ